MPGLVPGISLRSAPRGPNRDGRDKPAMTIYVRFFRPLLFLRPPFLRFGTFLPSLRASDRPMAMACLRLFTLRPLPDLSLPRLNLCISRSTSLDALFEYFRAMRFSQFDTVRLA